MASKGCQLADVSRPLLRAQAIPDAEWETRRARLVELYLETNASRKEVVDTMARDNFTITYGFALRTSLASADLEK